MVLESRAIEIEDLGRQVRRALLSDTCKAPRADGAFHRTITAGPLYLYLT